MNNDNWLKLAIIAMFLELLAHLFIISPFVHLSEPKWHWEYLQLTPH